MHMYKVLLYNVYYLYMLKNKQLIFSVCIYLYRDLQRLPFKNDLCIIKESEPLLSFIYTFLISHSEKVYIPINNYNSKSYVKFTRFYEYRTINLNNYDMTSFKWFYDMNKKY